MKYLSHFGDFVNGNSIEKTEAIDRRASAKPGLINLDKRISTCGTRHVIYPWNQSQIENRKSSLPPNLNLKSIDNLYKFCIVV
ncbi:hypothetical protein [Microcoleus sp. PH2017_36_ELK_O_B]|uniref:hypothetical protein n=1 Tax=Microcoleus sp. PH2017_36_ELK_O_B TaxID=2798846 RepID=UPI0025D4E7DE|nr:hypothetical protein [Microcoleus sp. PH2017_36_ELK_O_B]